MGPAKRVDALIDATLQFLLENEFIARRDGGATSKPSKEEADGSKKTGSGGCCQPEYRATQLGTATVASTLSPDDAMVVFSEFQQARRAFVLENELHIIYLVSRAT